MLVEKNFDIFSKKVGCYWKNTTYPTFEVAAEAFGSSGVEQNQPNQTVYHVSHESTSSVTRRNASSQTRLLWSHSHPAVLLETLMQGNKILAAHVRGK